MATQSQPRRSRGAAQADKDALDAIAGVISSPVTARSLREIDATYRHVVEQIVELVQSTGRLP